MILDEFRCRSLRFLENNFLSLVSVRGCQLELDPGATERICFIALNVY